MGDINCIKEERIKRKGRVNPFFFTMIKDYLRIAVRNLRHRKIRSWLTMIGIFIGIAAFVAIFSLGNGLKLVVSSQFGVSSTEVITVQAGGFSGAGPPGSFVVNPLTEDDADAIEKLSNVDMAISRVIEQKKLEFNDDCSLIKQTKEN